jgi:hypothetical protein
MNSPRTRRNADVDIRELQRRAAAGDTEASDQLVVADLRTGRLSYEEAVGVMVASRGPVLGWTPIWDYPGVLRLTPPPPWDRRVAILTTPWWEREGTSFSPLSLAPTDGSMEHGLRDLFTPNTGDLQGDVDHYRHELTGAIMALSFAGAAGLQAYAALDPEPPETLWNAMDFAWGQMTEGLGGA